MGTRNLTVVMSGGEYKIAQYGQWDGHPDGQGMTVLTFCRKHLSTAPGRKAFKKKLANVRFIGEAEHKALWTQVGADPNENTVDMKTADAFAERWPSLSRNTAAEILGMVRKSEGEVLTTNQIDFAGDSLFCEWAYVVDLDRRTLEVFKGFNKQPLAPVERFANAPRDPKSHEYYPVRRVAVFKLKELPNKREFLKRFKTDEE